MSGTSMDGLDVALCLCRGAGSQTTVTVLNFETVPYDPHFRERLKLIFAKRNADLQLVCLLNEWIALRHAEIILECLDKWEIPAEDIDLIAGHGQTIFHAPKSLHGLEGYPDGTLQIGDGDHIAVKTGIITLCDFRQKHLAAGGEGAPLAVYGDYLIFSKPGENRIMLNIGGISNITFLPADQDASKVFSTDIGPGNTLMDQFVQLYYPGLFYDKDAEIALSGTLNAKLLDALLDHPFFEAGFPKTTGPELFNLNYLDKALTRSGTENIPKENILATLCGFSAAAIVNAIQRCFAGEDSPVVYMSGGGIHNPLLVKQIIESLPFARSPATDELQINPDAKEAVLFAILANETVAGNAINFGGRQGIPSVCMGKICLPG